MAINAIRNAIRKCSRCGGSLLNDAAGMITCIACGQESPTPVFNTTEAPHQRPEPPGSASQASHWEEIALQELKISIIHIEHLQAEYRAAVAEAHRLRQALRRWGTENLPTVPGHYYNPTKRLSQGSKP